MNRDQAAERIESLKAGGLAAIVTAIVFLGIRGLYEIFRLQFFRDYQRLEMSFNTTSLLKLIIILLSGFLFGITYRYIVRQDTNPQLKAGAVMAFGLVRGLAQAETNLAQIQLVTVNFADIFTNKAIWPIGIGIVESVILFALAALVLDQAIGRGWIKTFTAF